MPGSDALTTLLVPEVRPRIIELLDLTLLGLERGIVDRPAIDARRCSGLEARDRKTRLLQLLRKVCSRGLTSSATGDTSLDADMNPTAQESTRSDYNAFCAEASPLEGLNAEYTLFVRCKKEACNGSLHGLKVCLLFEEGSDGSAVKSAIALRARSPDSGPFAAIQHPELNHGEIGGLSHDSSQCIDLAHYRTFRNASNGRIARHLADRLERARDQADPSTKTRSSNRCLGPRMASAYDYNVEFGFEARQLRHTLKIKSTLVLPSVSS